MQQCLKKTCRDTLGRLAKVEELNYDSSVYSTAAYAYNARDQIERIRHHEGTDQSNVFQQRTFKYDGHGRLSSRTTPEQGEWLYTYNADDTLHVMTDARGATHTYGYTPRGLVSSVTYGVPAGVAPTNNVTYAYDAAGNRTQMTEKDGNNVVVGGAVYHYDSLSRMDWEERTFAGAGTFRLTYGYNNAGLTSVTEPSQLGGAQVTYTADHTGATTGVNGSGPWTSSVYSQVIDYRASGGVKSETYGNGRVLSVAYNKMMRVTDWGVSGVQGWKYSYSDFGENTGRVTYAQNTYESGPGQADPTLDHSYDYDGVGRLLNSYTGTEARAHAGRAGGAWGVHDGPYSQAYLKDVWGNVTRKWGRAGDPDQFIATYTNNRRDGFSYDAAGNLTFDGGQSFTYDATGQQATASYGGYTLQQAYDGDRLRVRKTENGVTTYYLRSSVLGGQVVAELSGSGSWQRGYVYGPRGGLLSMRVPGAVTWVYQDPVTKTQRTADSAGNVTAGVDLDPWGRETNRGWNQQQFTRRYTSYERDGNGSDEATHRRYNRWHLRFDQPDPYDGSYDMADPQTFNRYTYTNNDPVNFTDPSGLKAKCDGVEVTDQATGQTTCLGLRDFGAVTVKPGGGSSDGLASLIFGRIAHNLRLRPISLMSDLRMIGGGAAITQQEGPGQTDCLRFADLVQGIADASNSVADFLDGMARTFTGADNASFNELRTNAERDIRNLPGRVVFGPANGPNGGFKSDFRDPSNQARHFVGGFLAVAVGGIVGFVRMQTRENSENSADDADRRLNGVSASFASKYINLDMNIQAIRRGFAADIRKRVCQ